MVVKPNILGLDIHFDLCYSGFINGDPDETGDVLDCESGYRGFESLGPPQV